MNINIVKFNLLTIYTVIKNIYNKNKGEYIMKCKKCGMQLIKDSNTCIECGTIVKKKFYTKPWFWLLCLITSSTLLFGSFLFFTVVGIELFITSIIMFKKAIKTKKFIKPILLLVFAFAFLGIGISLGNSPVIESTKYSYVQDVGWRQGTDKSFNEKEYKSNCAIALTYNEYDNNPIKYKGILYAVTGIVNYVEKTDAITYVFIIIDNNDTMWGINYFSGHDPNVSIGDKITAYGEFYDVVSHSLLINAMYFDERK